MNRESLYKSDDEDDDDDIGEDLDDLRLACIVSKEANSVIPSSDSENEDDFELLRSIKSQLASSSTNVDLSLPLDSENDEEDDFEMLQSIKNQLESSMDEEEDEDSDDAFETLCAIRRRFSKLNDSEQQVHEKTYIDKTKSSSFPESAQAFVDAIRRNRSYQKLLRKKLTEIEATIEQNEKHKKNVLIVKDFQASCKRITKQALSQRKDPHVELISTRKSSSKGNDRKTSSSSSPLTLGPPENHCVADYKMALEKYSISLYRRNWTKKENENLAKGLNQQLQETLIREATEQSSDLDDINSILEGISNLEITPEMIRQFLPKVNWDQLDIKNRSAAECEARWMSSEDPLINKSTTWTKAEEDYIRLTTKNKSFTDWLDIAVSLGTNRTPFQCLSRYQRSLNPNMLESEWTKEKEDQLRAAVDLFGEKNWESVANALQGRIGPQCSNKWKKSRERKGWSSEEVERLKVAMTFFGAENWHRIARFVPGRTGPQCQAKWNGSLDGKVNRGKWTEEENEKLIQVTKEHGIGKWTKVASSLPGRTRWQCRKQWERFNSHLMPLIRKARSLRKEATMGNFVDRESERPHLDTGDFLALAEISLEQEQARIAERQPKRRRKGTERSSGDVCSTQENENVCENEANNGGEVRCLEWHNEFQESVKEKQQRGKRKNVAGTLSNNSSVIKKLKPRRKVSEEVLIENQDSSMTQ